MAPTSPVAAFFDLDRTLLRVNSGSLWLQRERRHGRLSSWQLLQGGLFLLAYHFYGLDMERVFQKALATVKGLDEETLRRWTQEWYQAEVAQHAAPGGLATVQAHRQAGHQLVLLTSSSLYESEVASQQFGLHGFRCTRYGVVDGKFTGAVALPLCYAAGKVAHAEDYAAMHGIDVGQSYFYTDSFTDLPMLERVAHPRVVQPDPRLRRTARARGWPILDWSKAGGEVKL